MNLFLDTEFTELSQKAQIISLALVSENGQEFYAEFKDYSRNEISGWSLVHVIPNLILHEKEDCFVGNTKTRLKGSREEIRGALKFWLSQFGEKKGSLQCWADNPAYDWILFCELFGGALHIPPSIHYMCLDVATLFWKKGYDPDMDRVVFSGFSDEVTGRKHNALYDALVLKIAFKKLQQHNK